MSASPPYWQIDIQKRMGNEFWTNVYHTARTDLAAAQSVAEALVTLERQIHLAAVTFTSYSVRPFPGPSEGTITPVALQGTSPNAPYLPLFNVLRVDFPAPVGRPSRKFYRLPMASSNATDGVLNTATRDSYQNTFDTFMASPAAAGLIDVDGQLLTNARVFGPLGMRQLRRGSRRRVTPVIPVS